MEKKHGLAVIGFGGMGSHHVIDALDSDVVDVKGIWDIREECRKAAEAGLRVWADYQTYNPDKEKLKRPVHAYESLEDLLADESVDIVTIATPNDVHEELAIACMNAGKNVISEKPVTLSVASLERMIEASKKNNVKFSVHQNRRWDEDYLAVKKLFDENTLGEIVSIESRQHGSRGIPGDWRGKKQYGGGMLYDWGIHLIDRVLMLYENVKVTSVFCEFDHITNKEVDDGFQLVLRFENGARAYFEVGSCNFIRFPRFYVRGRKGTACIENHSGPCQIVECTQWDEKEVAPIKTGAGYTKTMAPRGAGTTNSYSVELPESDHHDYYRNFCAAVEGREEQIVTHKQMLRVMRVIEAGFESVEKNQVIQFEDII